GRAGAPLLLFARHTDEQLVIEAERADDALTDHVAIIPAGDRLDDHRQSQVGAAAVVLQLRAGRPFRAEVADLGAHAGVVDPALAADIGAGETGLMRRHLEQGDLVFA